MSKEITCFVIDLALRPWGDTQKSEQDAGSEEIPGLDYFYDSMIKKIMKARKTDYVSIIACHSSITNNSFSDNKEFEGINVICNKVVPTYSTLKQYKDMLKPTEAQPEQGDCVKAMLVAIAMMQPDIKLKFIRNIVLITDGGEEITSFDTPLLEASIQSVNNNNINVFIIGIDFGHSESSDRKKHNEEKWMQLLESYENGKFIDSSKISNILKYVPPLKRVKPIRSYQGQMKFGGDPKSLEYSDSLKGEEFAPVSFNVDVFPAARPEKLTNAHQYHVKDDVIQKTKSEVHHYITVDKSKEREEGVEIEKVPIDKQEIVSGFKFSNYDLLAMLEDLKKDSILPVSSSMDILGFIHKDDLPIAFFTLESNYILPSDGPTKNFVGFSAFCQSLIETDSIVLLRYVAKDVDFSKGTAEVQICGGIPCKLKINQQYVFGLSMVRLPFREDEKMGRFPFLLPKKEFETDEPKYYDEDEINEELMEKFVLSKDLDSVKNESRDPYLIDNKKLTLTANEGISNVVESQDTDSKLLINSPALRKYDSNLTKIIKKSLSKDMNEFLSDPEFISNHMVEQSSNLFNLSNVLRRLEADDWLVELNERAYLPTKRLTKIVKPYKHRKGRSEKKEKFNGIYVRSTGKGQIEMEEEDPLDINDLLS